MKTISAWIRSRPVAGKKKSGDIEKQLGELEAEAARAPEGLRGLPLNKAGDLCELIGERTRALSYYGRAIDAMLEDRQPDPARAVATKIIRIHPKAVRTLRTLTWLDLASRHMATALEHLRLYKEASKRGEGGPDLTSPHILAMAGIVSEKEFLSAAAGALDELGHSDEAARVRDWVMVGGSPQAIDDPEELAGYCLSAAVD